MKSQNKTFRIPDDVDDYLAKLANMYNVSQAKIITTLILNKAREEKLLKSDSKSVFDLISN